MKAEELMVGDWVMWKNRQVQIASVSGIVYSFGQIDVVLAHCNDDNLLEKHDIKSVSPIPLTPEILEKNGWHYNGVYSYFSYLDMKLEFYHHEGIFRIYWKEQTGFQSLPGMNYVHQLQHALKLCGIDLEINI